MKNLEEYMRGIVAADVKKVQEENAARDQEVLKRWGYEAPVSAPEEKKEDLQEDCGCKTSVTGDEMAVDTDSQAKEDAKEEEKEEKKEEAAAKDAESDDEEEKKEISEEELQTIVSQLKEVAPPDADLEAWASSEDVKKAFKERYGDRWKEVMYGHAWNMYNKKDGE